MKKQILAAVLAGAMTLLCACGAQDPKPTTVPTQPAETQSAQMFEETTAETVQTTAAKTVDEAVWKQAYKTHMLDLYKSLTSGGGSLEPGASFRLDDVDGDGIPELLVSPATYHAASGQLVSFDGEKVHVHDLGSFGAFQYLPGNGIVAGGYSGSGSSSYSVYKLVNGDLEDVWEGTEYMDFAAYMTDPDNDGEEPEYFYKIGDRDVSKAEYDEQYAKYVPKGLISSRGDDGNTHAEDHPISLQEIDAVFG